MNKMELDDAEESVLAFATYRRAPDPSTDTFRHVPICELDNTYRMNTTLTKYASAASLLSNQQGNQQTLQHQHHNQGIAHYGISPSYYMAAQAAKQHQAPQYPAMTFYDGYTNGLTGNSPHFFNGIHRQNSGSWTSIASTAIMKETAPLPQKIPSIKSQETLKANSKNTYINKINSLMSETNVPIIKKSLKSGRSEEIVGGTTNGDVSGTILMLHPQTMTKTQKTTDLEEDLDSTPLSRSLQQQQIERKRSSGDFLVENHGGKQTKKLARNRESARNSRLRKKFYIELLEKKVAALQAKLEEAGSLLTGFNSKVQSICGRTQSVNNFIVGREALFNRLETALIERDGDISLLLDSIRYRFGVNGRERQQVIKQLNSKLKEVSLPNQVKYLLWAATQQKTTTGTNSKTVWDELFHKLQLSDSQIDALKPLKDQLVEVAGNIESLFDRMTDQKEEVTRRLMALQEPIDDLSNSLTPVQIGAFALLLENGLKASQIDLDIFELQDKWLDMENDVKLGADMLEEQTMPISDRALQENPVINISDTYEIYQQTQEFLRKRKRHEA